MTAPTIDATMEREIVDQLEVFALYVAFVGVCETPERWAWARANPEAAADSLNLGGRVRWAFLAALSGEGARAPAGFHGGGHAFWRS